MTQTPSRRPIAAALAAVLLIAAAPPVTQLETVYDPPSEKAAAAAAAAADEVAQEIAFRTDLSSRLTVAVTLSGAGPYRFLVDTGADRTAVSSQIANALRLDKGGGARLHSLTGVSAAPTARVPQLQISERQLANLEAVVLDRGHMGADGVLGTDTLHSQRVLFDFKRKTLSIIPSRAREIREERGTIMVRARARAGRLIVTDAVADGRQLVVVIDTGSEVTVGNAALRRILSRRQIREEGPVELMSVTGEKMIGNSTSLSRLELGEVRLEQLNIVFAEAHTFSQMGLTDVPALLLGMNALKAFDRVSIDFAGKKLRVRLPDSSRVDSSLRLAAR